MPNITIKKVRTGTDLLMHVTLKDNGVKVSWKSVENIFVFLFADDQGIMAGRAEASIDPADEYTLIVTYGVNEPEYLGVNRLVVNCVYDGKTATYDCPVIEFVETSAEEGETTVEVTQVDLEVSAVNTSLLDEAISACIAATAEAVDIVAVINAKLMSGEFKGGKGDKGDKGDKGEDGKDGKDGGLLFPSFSYDAATGVFTIEGKETEVSRFEYNIDEGLLTIKL